MKHVPTLTALAVLPGETTPRVSSRHIAEAFDKNHRHVLRKIKELITECPSNFGESNFGPSNYLDQQGKSQPHYLLTRDAFSLLVMGFTGPRALIWKVRYIEAFNMLERELLSQNMLAGPDGAAIMRKGLAWAKRLTPARRREIKKAAHYAALGLSKAEIGRLLNCGEYKVKSLIQENGWLSGGAA